ncbi:1-acyl-sn-glycerol-3-phosphate acyltransferase [Aetokthonos hydrillicola Thurmond2011]|uniref:1-acyl-sn-glycerol-3-phosphate acyltransferase n=1 Tax=Aetokthonos hydrillicola Thurmond2011 TaxID=2712845 RepID=A0AAP5I9W7_9CYAN|nr:1-acyl-sn-glycerol-3-phosphate acyltransferase [Aetokthonos hydrillicola]MBO3461105.1 glycerol acyltransferase [Aetokthonos hydrillicola CCALA 1050]MBW4590674.1 1-acyl-sn-glycerol-3-phosphate acyltransferase [Aetokthonos hydrillicola CCALA 1050]MDR9897652.1 1-acyl-sn-glycerol-3-phosphate acyltransferase [Aetokthonos hydrillicola Thurmond2011]
MIHQNSENLLNPQREQASSKGYQFSWFDWFCLWYPPGWLILFNRHWQHYHTDPDGWNWLEYGLFLLPGGFYLALLIRWLRLGCRSPRREIEEFNPGYQHAFGEEVLAPIVKYYFRAELQQVENLPETQPMIVVMNHAGMCFPWDFVTLSYLLSKAQGWVVQPLAGVSLFDHPWVIWWLPPGWAKVLGGVRAELKDFDAAIQQGTILLYAPEGLRGPRKGWRRRYQLERFDLSFIQLSQRYQAPILPVICLGNENLHSWAVNFKKLQRLLKLPFLPLSPLMLVFILFPSMGIWAMKSHLRYFIQPLERLSLISTDNDSSKERSSAYKHAQELREKMQNQIRRYLTTKNSAGASALES